MNNPTDIKNRIKVIENTRKITRAMETVSVSKMGKAVRILEQNEAYFAKLREVIGDIILGTSDWVHPFFKKRDGLRAAFLVIASDKGLVGGFNNRIFEFAENIMNGYDKPTVLTVGDMTRRFFERKGVTVSNKFCDYSFDPSIDDAKEIAEYIIELFSSDEIDEVFAVYTGYSVAQGESLEVIRLLPLVKEKVCDDSALTAEKESYLRELYYEPSADEVLEKLIPQYVAGIVYGCLLQSVAAEYSSRRLAMNVAARNADELIESLKLDYNRARQNSVTEEIRDIVTATGEICNETKSE